jgi:hypothetical protein
MQCSVVSKCLACLRDMQHARLVGSVVRPMAEGQLQRPNWFGGQLVIPFHLTRCSVIIRLSIVLPEGKMRPANYNVTVAVWCSFSLPDPSAGWPRGLLP